MVAAGDSGWCSLYVGGVKYTGTRTINPSRGDTAPTDWSDTPYAIVVNGTLKPGAEKFFQYMTGRPCRMARDTDGNPCVKSRPRNASWQKRRSRRRAIAALRRAKQRMSRLYVWHSGLVRRSACGNWLAFNQVPIRRGNLYVADLSTWRAR